MLASAVVFTSMTALVKLLGADYSASLQTFYRQAAGLVAFAPVILLQGRRVFATTRPISMILRSAGAVAAINLSFFSYQRLELADANALSFTRTLWIALLAVLFLRERLGPLRIGAVAAGFLGVVIIAGPLSGEVDPVGLAAALGAALLLAITLTGMKFMSRDHSTSTLIAWSAGLGFLFSIPGAALDWVVPSGPDLGLLALMGVLGLAAQYFYFRGMQLGDASAMTPIDYTRLIFAAGWGWLLFRDVPSLSTVVGAGIIIVSTLALVWHEARLARMASTPL